MEALEIRAKQAYNKRDLGSLYRVAMDAINGMKQAAAIQQAAFFKCNKCKITYHASQVTFMGQTAYCKKCFDYGETVTEDLG